MLKFPWKDVLKSVLLNHIRVTEDYFNVGILLVIPFEKYF